MCAATCGKGTKPIRVRNPARFALRHDEIHARHRSPLHIRRTGASATVDTMTIDQSSWLTPHHVSCPPANASSTNFHTTDLPEQMIQRIPRVGIACNSRLGLPQTSSVGGDDERSALALTHTFRSELLTSVTAGEQVLDSALASPLVVQSELAWASGWVLLSQSVSE